MLQLIVMITLPLIAFLLLLCFIRLSSLLAVLERFGEVSLQHLRQIQDAGEHSKAALYTLNSKIPERDSEDWDETAFQLERRERARPEADPGA